MEQGLQQFIEGMPKIELHLHIEGSLEPELMFKLAKRNGITLPYANVEALREAYAFSNLQEFLDLYYQGMSVLLNEQDYYDLTMAYLSRVEKQHVSHVEIFFDPQGHTERGVAFATVIGGITRALDDGRQRLGISSKLIMSFLRHLSEEDAFAELDKAEPHMAHIHGFGLDSSEKGHPPSKFVRLYDRLRATGKPLMAHAGEEGPPEYVIEAIDLLKIDRIDHGNRSLEDEALTQRLAQKAIGLTVCPLSNLKLCVVKDMKQHPLKRMLDKGLKATVNSDDPAYFGGYMNENFVSVAEALSLTRQDVLQLAQNAIDVSFMDASEKRQKTLQLAAYAAGAQ